MKKYSRLPLSVEAQQYFPYSKIDVDGFRNIEEDVLDEQTMEKKRVVLGGEIVQGDVKISLSPGDWVLVLPNQSVTIRKDAEFSTDFIEGGLGE